MYSKISKILFVILSVAFLHSAHAIAADKAISFLSESDTDSINAIEGSTFSVNVKVDNADTIAGASFTVTYDTDNLTLTDVTSSFFGTFTEQAISTPGDTGYVEVDGDKYYSPKVDATLAGTGSMIAAARIDNGAGTNVILFTLTFEATGASGVYPISATQSIITNADAGYDDPTHLDYFVGIGTDTYPTHTANTINDCFGIITEKIIVPDYDGIDDNWEIINRPDRVDINDADVLGYFSATGDADRDGYSDLQEYLNRDLLDSLNNPYDPTIKNAADGPGYIAIRISLPAVNLLLLD